MFFLRVEAVYRISGRAAVLLGRMIKR